MNRKWTFNLLIGIVTVFGLFSCATEDEEIRPKTVADVIINESRFSIFRSVLQQAGFSDALKSGQFTVFAPNNEAFNKMSISDASQVGSMSPDSLRAIVSYLILDGERKAESFASGEKLAVNTLLDAPLYISKNETVFKVNMANVVKQDISADNGVVHEIDHVPSISKLTTVEWVRSNPSFSFLAAAVTRAVILQPQLIEQLITSPNGFTLFAPSNQAFINAGFPTIESLNELSSEALINVLGAHILRNTYFSTDLKSGQVGTLLGAPIMISAGNVITLAGNNNGSPLPTVSRSDLMTKDGVIHILDGLIIP